MQIPRYEADSYEAHQTCMAQKAAWCSNEKHILGRDGRSASETSARSVQMRPAAREKQNLAQENMLAQA